MAHEVHIQVPLMLDQKLPAPRLPWQPRVSTIYQRFTSEDEGIVQNIVKFGDGLLLDRTNGATFVVNAAWFKSPGNERTIELTFESAQVCSLNPTSAFEAALAPPLLPRTSLQHLLLLALVEVRIFHSFSCPAPSKFMSELLDLLAV